MKNDIIIYTASMSLHRGIPSTEDRCWNEEPTSFEEGPRCMSSTIPIYTAREQKRLREPWRLFWEHDELSLEIDGDSLQAEKPYIFIGSAANQFQRSKDPLGRLVRTKGA